MTDDDVKTRMSAILGAGPEGDARADLFLKLFDLVGTHEATRGSVTDAAYALEQASIYLCGEALTRNGQSHEVAPSNALAAARRALSAMRPSGSSMSRLVSLAVRNLWRLAS
jgi:hypothetical protein